MTKPFKIRIESHGNTHESTLSWDTNCEEALSAFVGLLVTAGFHINSIEDTMRQLIHDSDSVKYLTSE